MKEPLVPGFTLVQRIGEGGQAQVYLAERDYDGLRVALKVLDSRVRQDKVFLERFVREYKLLAKLDIEHVARIYDQSFAGDHPYIAMEYLPSGTLAARIHEGLTPRAALRITAPVPRLPEALAMHQPLLERMLAKEPSDRFQSAADLAATITL